MRFFATALVFVLASIATAQEVGASYLKEDVEYGRAGKVPLLLDIATPAGAGPFPIAILIHGGGWTGGDKKGAITSLIPSLTEAGFACLSINYRLAPDHRWPACRDDVLTAIRWTKAHAAEFRGDPEKVALLGYSAGGHLACVAPTVVDESTSVQAVVGIAALTDFVQELPKRGNILGRAQQGLLNRPEQLTPESLGMLRALSPINHVRPGLPPFLMMHGDADGSVPYEQSIAFRKKLRANGVSCELLTIPGGTHKLAQWEEQVADYQARMINWLKSALSRPAAGLPLRGVPYGEKNGEPLLLDVRPGSGALPQPVVILIHGGGWSSGDKSGAERPESGADISPWFPHLQAAGFVAFSINYRLAPAHRWPSCAEDVATAIRWVKTHAADYGGDPDRIVLFGHSAGGHLAFWAGLTADAETRVQAIVGYAPVTDLAFDTSHRGRLSLSLQQLLDRHPEPDSAAWKQLRELSPVNQLTDSAPPMLIVHGAGDKTVPLPMSQAFVDAAQSKKLRCDMLILPEVGHRFTDWSKRAIGYEEKVTAWLDDVLNEK